MEHFYIDKYSSIDSMIHRIDPRIKIISAGILILSIIFTEVNSMPAFVLYAITILGLILLSRIPLRYVVKQSLTIIPFVFMVGILMPFLNKVNGLILFWNIFIKAYLITLSMIILVSSTSFPKLLKAFEKLKFPKLLIMIMSFMYRYIFVIMDELIEMKQAKDSRSIGGTKYFHLKTLGNMLGNLFIRSYERAESVYMAMCARGFNGSVITLDSFSINYRDIIFLFVVISIVILVRIVTVQP